MNSEKQFRACDFCRYRKKKCVTSTSETRNCCNCEYLGIACIRSNRRMSLKRHRKSKLIAEKVLSTIAYTTSAQSANEDLSSLALEQDNARVTADNTTTSIYTTPINHPIGFDVSQQGAVVIYNCHVRQFTPFLDPHYAGDCPDINVFINIAAQLGSRNRHTATTLNSHLTNKATHLLSNNPISFETAVGALLILGRIKLDIKLVEKVFLRIKNAIEFSPSMTAIIDPVLVGSYVSSLWYQFLNIVSMPLADLTEYCDKFSSFSTNLNSTDFINQYMIITKLLLRSQVLMKSNFLSLSSDEQDKKKYDWLTLEYDFLLWSLGLPPNLIDLRDEMPGLPPSRIIHVLFNTVYIEFYLYILRNKDLQEIFHLKPVPAVLHFIRALADSVFKCAVEVVDTWYIL